MPISRTAGCAPCGSPGPPRASERPYSHQRLAMDAALAGEDLVVVAAHGPGKTLCYNVPVLNAILQTRPTAPCTSSPPRHFPATRRRNSIPSSRIWARRSRPTPTMATPRLGAQGHPGGGPHRGHQPGHAPSGHFAAPRQVGQSFENLRYVVIDDPRLSRRVRLEPANVIRRLKAHLCRFYGANPTFICCSATIANPGELAER